MAKKILNNKVEFSAGGKYVKVRLSDEELKDLRRYSDYDKGADLSKMMFGTIHNFSLYAFLDYTLKTSQKACRVMEVFPYHEYDYVMWNLE